MRARTLMAPGRWSALLVAGLVAGLLPAAPARAADPAGAAPAESTATVTGVGAGGSHTCAIWTDGSLACWGRAWDDEDPAPLPTPPDGTFTAISAGGAHTCAIRTDGTLACWGSNGSGLATPPEGVFTTVSAGGAHTCAIRTDGTLACWGRNGDGQAMPPEGTFLAVEAGDAHTCAIRTDGTLACWGRNSSGQATPPEGTFTTVSSGYAHTCAIRTDGTLACWGFNYYGQATPPDGTFTAVGAGGEHTCAIRTDGTLACWGGNYYGQASPPARTPTAISAGGGHTCAIATDGMLACWGYPTARPHPKLAATTSPRWIASRTVRVAWGAVPALYPMASYDVRYQRLRWNDSWYRGGVWFAATAATSGRFTGRPGSTYCFDVRARDVAGNLSPWQNFPDPEERQWPTFNEAACTAIPLDDRSLARSAGWTALTGERFYRSTALRTYRYGATLTRTNVSSDRLRLVATTCPTCGKVQVYINRRLVRTISLYSRTRADRAILPIGRFGLWGDTVTIKVVSSGKKVIIDGLSVYRTWID